MWMQCQRHLRCFFLFTYVLFLFQKQATPRASNIWSEWDEEHWGVRSLTAHRGNWTGTLIIHNITFLNTQTTLNRRTTNYTRISNYIFQNPTPVPDAGIIKTPLSKSKNNCNPLPPTLRIMATPLLKPWNYINPPSPKLGDYCDNLPPNPVN